MTPEPLADRFADTLRIGDPTEICDVQIVVQTVSLIVRTAATTATRRADLKIRNTEEPLQRSLLDAHVLDIRERHCLLVHLHQALADAQAAVRDEIPPLLEVEAQKRERPQSLRKEQKRATDFEKREQYHEVRLRVAFGDR